MVWGSCVYQQVPFWSPSCLGTHLKDNTIPSSKRRRQCRDHREEKRMHARLDIDDTSTTPSIDIILAIGNTILHLEILLQTQRHIVCPKFLQGKDDLSTHLLVRVSRVCADGILDFFNMLHQHRLQSVELCLAVSRVLGAAVDVGGEDA